MNGWDTSSMTDMTFMFKGCGSLKEVDMSSWEAGGITSMSFMFQNCSGLKIIKLPRNLKENFCDLPYNVSPHAYYGIWKDAAGNTYTEYLPATTGESVTITKSEGMD